MPQSNPANLITVTNSCAWDLPNIINVNARSLNIAKLDELQAIVDVNDVSVAGITETWYKEYIPDCAVSLAGFTCERKDRNAGRGGGVACFIKYGLSYVRLLSVEDQSYEVLWLRLTPKRLPRKFSCIIVACLYHPPSADNGLMRQYMISSMDTLLRKYPNAGFIILGDFNRLYDSFLKTHYGLAQLVSTPTRGMSVLDKMWSNMSCVYDKARVISELGTSDHKMTLLVRTGIPSIEAGQATQKTTRVTGEKQKRLFASILGYIRWEPLYALPSCEMQFRYFTDILEQLTEYCFPLRTTTSHSSDKPWVTNHFRQLIRKRQQMINAGDRQGAKPLRNKINRLASELRTRFYQKKVAALENSANRDWWKHMKSLMGLSSSGASSLQGLANQQSCEDMAELANKINEHFTSITSDMPRMTEDHRIFTSQHPPTSMAEYTISVEDTERALTRIKANKSTGPDGIPPWLLKEFSWLLARPITAIFNSSLREGYIPKEWKSAHVVPLPKCHPVQSMSDIRPISLTPVIAKVLESIVLRWFNLDIQNRIDPNQFGCQSGTSTTDALVEILHKWYEATDTCGNFARVVLLDYSKAFDLINHNTLINKLLEVGVSPCIVRWMASFLMNRTQRVKIEDNMSDEASPNGGIPQGTVSGPKNFLAQVNDMRSTVPLYKYVDDGTLFEICSEVGDSHLQDAVDDILAWSEANQMKLNPQKTKEMIICFCRNGSHHDSIPNISIDGRMVDRVTEAKILGVTVSSDLTWNHHVRSITPKAGKRLYMLY